VFYTSNRFNIESHDSDVEDAERASMRTAIFEASTFFTKTVPRDCLHLLRDVEIHFSAWTYSRHGIDSAILEDWKATVAYIATYITNFTLAVFMGISADPRHHIMDVRHPFRCQEALDEVQRQLVLPLRLLRIKAFFVYAQSPYWTDPAEVNRDDIWHAKELEK
jgi:hypothetical protein